MDVLAGMLTSVGLCLGEYKCAGLENRASAPQCSAVLCCWGQARERQKTKFSLFARHRAQLERPGHCAEVRRSAGQIVKSAQQPFIIRIVKVI